MKLGPEKHMEAEKSFAFLPAFSRASFKPFTSFIEGQRTHSRAARKILWMHPKKGARYRIYGSTISGKME